MRFGADYYPEHWPEERWAEDARLMQEAGFNTVRMAEFAWVKVEPEEGRFEFDWLLKALDILGKRGISAVIGTPTATPPAWLCTSKPEIMRFDEDRRQITFGNRQQSCINQTEYRAASDRIVTAYAETLSMRPEVIGWQIDNEFSALCYCEECRRQFQDWLQAKYGSLDALEAAWGTIFWSQTYTDWRQIPLPWKTSNEPNPSLALDFRRFFSHCYASFQARQIEIIRAHSDKPIMHNFMGIWPEDLDYQKLADQLDFASWDNYPFGSADPAGVAACHDLTRGYLGKNFWVMEQMSGPGGWGEMSPTPRPDRIREWTYQSVARGADGIVYFRWRPCRSGTEQYWHGILNHDGTTNRRYNEIKRTGEELKSLEDLLEGTTVKAEVAFINDYDSRFAFQYQRGNPEFSYSNLFLSLYRGLYERNIPVDIISGNRDLSRYKLVVAPAMFVLSKDRAAQFKDYVCRGGTLVMTFRSAVKDATGLIFNEALPGMLQDVFGATVREYHSPAPDEDNTIWGSSGAVKGLTSQAKVWLDFLELTTARVVARYTGELLSDGPAITRNEFGSGKAFYIGTQPSAEFIYALMGDIAAEAAISGIETPSGVEAVSRVGNGREILFLINHSEEPRTVCLPGRFGAKDGPRSIAVGRLGCDKEVVDEVALDPYHVAVLEY